LKKTQRGASLSSNGWDERVLGWSTSLVWLYKLVGCAAKKRQRKGEGERRK